MKSSCQMLAGVGLGTLLIGISGCGTGMLASRPAFSPDSRKIVFPVFDTSSNQATVMLYDRETKRLEPIFTRTFHDDSAYAMAAVWTPDGKQVVVCTADVWPSQGTRSGFAPEHRFLDRRPLLRGPDRVATGPAFSADHR